MEGRTPMTFRLNIFLWIAIFFYFLCILHLLKKRKLTLKYSLMWIFSGIVIFLIILFPSIFNMLMSKIGIVNASNGLFAICIFLFLIILLMLTSIISGMNNKIKTLIQMEGINEKRIRELEKISKDSN